MTRRGLVLYTALGFMLFGELIAEVGPVRATVITHVNPAMAAVLGVLVLHETFTVAMAVGFVLVIVGSALATRGSGSEAAVAAPDLGPSGREPVVNTARLTDEG